MVMMEQRFHLGQRPRARIDRIPAKLGERLGALIAVYEHVPVRLDHHDHRDLLALLGQRGQKPMSPGLIADAKVAVT